MHFLDPWACLYSEREVGMAAVTHRILQPPKITTRIAGYCELPLYASGEGAQVIYDR